MKDQIDQRVALGVNKVTSTQYGLHQSFNAAETNIQAYKTVKVVGQAHAAAKSVYSDLKGEVESAHEHAKGFGYTHRIDNLHSHDYEALVDNATYKFEAAINGIDKQWVYVITTVKTDAHLRLINLGVYVEKQIQD